ncbi:hypothetical protein Taro_054414 [Colocasia esculenta]|uniref:UBZ4-type domain-containing protein n=1 Tax=Colocasia esculenta TaxID=4460 RepID=A0A843XR16_COLES|nr:hypothetical protein [Colocasia esculenta]
MPLMCEWVVLLFHLFEERNPSLSLSLSLFFLLSPPTSVLSLFVPYEEIVLLLFLAFSFLVPGGNPHRGNAFGARKVESLGGAEAVRCCLLWLPYSGSAWSLVWFLLVLFFSPLFFLCFLENFLPRRTFSGVVCAALPLPPPGCWITAYFSSPCRRIWRWVSTNALTIIEAVAQGKAYCSSRWGCRHRREKKRAGRLQMLSVANPPDPPCPSKAPALNGDEKGRPSKSPSSSPDQADPADGPDEAQHPRFSIRDYVFASRSRDVRTHWPFPQRYLQLCLKHGVRDLLPPVEPPDLVRARSSSWNGKLVPADHLWNACPEVEQTQIEVSDAVKCAFSQPTQEPVSGSSHQPRISPLSVEKTTVLADVYEDELCRAAETESGVTADHDHSRSIPSSVSLFPGSVQETTGTVSESSSGVGVVKPPRLAENFGGTSERSIKKCRLIVKFGGAPESNRTEEAVSSLSSVSDSMASKVCPVCKAFTSSSNTTLNAHIDQCLSSESSAKWDAMKLSQHKVKPRKKRSMEEIYATAARCTLEDLDRRNGTNWALDFSSIRQNSEALCTTERKQPRISPVKATDDEREGAVYVDSNGMKLLILSKFNDAQSAAAGDYCAPKKCRKELKNKSPPFGKRNRLPQKYRKYTRNAKLMLAHPMRRE